MTSSTSHRILRNLLAASAGLAAIAGQPAAGQHKPCAAFSELRMTLERNATDGDTEVVLFAKGQDEGLRRLAITGPDGRHVGTVRGTGRRGGIGIREFALESAEPPDLGAVLRSFPEGVYRFEGRTVSNGCLKGKAPLSHRLAPATTLLAPLEGQVIDVQQLVLVWTEMPGVERYIVELNNETTGAEMKFDVFPPMTSLAIGAPLLQRGSEYQFAVGVRTASGNVTYVETTFFTAP